MSFIRTYPLSDLGAPTLISVEVGAKFICVNEVGCGDNYDLSFLVEKGGFGFEVRTFLFTSNSYYIIPDPNVFLGSITKRTQVIIHGEGNYPQVSLVTYYLFELLPPPPKLNRFDRIL